MPIISFTEKDMLRGKIVTPGWYRVRIDAAGQKPSNDAQSINYPMEGTILFNADTKSEEFAGVPTPDSWQFNSKAMGFAVGYLAAFGVTPEPGKRYELANTVGKEIDIFIENDTYQNRVVNRINHKYRAPQEAVQSELA
jgi:hypothetical protein